MGNRSEESAQALWDSLPPLYRQCAAYYTDEGGAYQGVLPANRHRIAAKGSGLTNYIERFNNALRQRVSRFIRETLSFSRGQANWLSIANQSKC